MEIGIIGTGYVGLVTGACFAEMGAKVTCVDVNKEKIENLKKGLLPIYEPGLQEIVLSNYAIGRLSFTTSIKDAVRDSEVLFIAVGTPTDVDGSADLQFVLQVAHEIGIYLDRPCVIVDKSTVPVGTAEKVKNCIQFELDKRLLQLDFDVVSNPEFLKEGAAIADFMSPDRIVVGTDSDRAKELMASLYSPFTRNHPRLVFMSVRDAEMTKYAANAMLATKISFMNEISNLCELMDVDVENVRLGIGSDERIGFHFIYPGAGYGGSCFPKDVKALVAMSDNAGFDPLLLKAVEQRNNLQKNKLFEKIVAQFGSNLDGMVIGIWGLAFKPGTDDMREAPSKILISSLLSAGAKVKAFDPVAMPAALLEFEENLFENGTLEFCGNQYEAAIDSDALVLVTEWKPFRNPDIKLLKKIMKNAVIFDGRNQYDPKVMRDSGFLYFGIGRNPKPINQPKNGKMI